MKKLFIILFSIVILSGVSMSSVDAKVINSTQPKVLSSSSAVIFYTPSYFSFREDLMNNGRIYNSVIFKLGSTPSSFTFFKGVTGENMISSGKLIITGVPVGLTASATRLSFDSVEVRFIGSALNHSNINDTYPTFSFQNSAFNVPASQVTNSTITNIKIDFRDTNGYLISSDL